MPEGQKLNEAEESLESVEQPQAAGEITISHDDDKDKDKEKKKKGKKDDDVQVIEAGKDGKAYIVPESTVTHEPPKKTPASVVKGVVRHVNIYLLVFIFLIFAAGLLTATSYVSEKTKETADVVGGTAPLSTITGQSLSEEALKQINGSETKVGDPKQILNIESNAIFSGKVLVRDSVDIAGGLNLGGNLQLPSILVTGQSRFANIQANELSLAGGANIQGAINGQNNLKISGTGEFGGNISAPSITINRLELNQALKLNGHLEMGGSPPRAQAGTAAGGGGTVSINGTDTAGTVNINVGSGPPAGILATITFTTAYGKPPRVVITPSNSNAAGIAYYVTNKTATSFSIAVAGVPPSTNHTFEYIVIESGIQ